MPHLHHKRPTDPGFGDEILSAIATPFTELAAAFGGRGEGNSKTGPKTITSYVYATQSPTFTNSVVAYSTYSPLPAATSSPTDQSSPSQSTGDAAAASSQDSSAPASQSSESSLPTSVTHTPSVHSTVPGTSSMNVRTSPASANTLATAATAAAASATSIVPDASTSSDGMSTGGKAGLAIGIILIIGAIAAAIFFCIQRRKTADHKRLEDEKSQEQNDIFAAHRAPSTRSVRTLSTAPRLSIRPVTEFLPGFGDNRNAAAAPRSAPSPSASERPMTSNDHNRENPFGNHAEAVDPVNAAGPPVIQATGPGGEAMAGAAAAGAVVGLARGASKRGNGPKPLDLTRKFPEVGQPSPSGTEFSFSEAASTPVATAGAAAIAAAGGPQNAMVHRVQLDFIPSMEDELEIHAGQLVRVLHEYDDGWALCIRLDRSQQGVVPRTCLSVRPVKPRLPQGGPRGPPKGMRALQGQPGGPMPGAANGAQRPASPAGGYPAAGPRYNPQDRPSSSAGRPVNPNEQARSNSPSPSQMQSRRLTPPEPRYNPQDRPSSSAGRLVNPNEQARSGSPSPSQMQSRRLTPPGPSGMNPNSTPSPQGSPPRQVARKPVPGQAM